MSFRRSTRLQTDAADGETIQNNNEDRITLKPTKRKAAPKSAKSTPKEKFVDSSKGKSRKQQKKGEKDLETFQNNEEDQITLKPAKRKVAPKTAKSTPEEKVSDIRKRKSRKQKEEGEREVETNKNSDDVPISLKPAKRKAESKTTKSTPKEKAVDSIKGKSRKQQGTEKEVKTIQNSEEDAIILKPAKRKEASKTTESTPKEKVTDSRKRKSRKQEEEGEDQEVVVAEPAISKKLFAACLPRVRETYILQKKRDDSKKASGTTADNLYLHVMGIDEAGRGPLAGPVVAAAAICPKDIPGIVDSKQLTSEADREVLYEKIVASPDVRWAVAVVDAARIDEVNILQATLQGMAVAAHTVIHGACTNYNGFSQYEVPLFTHPGSYVCFGANDNKGHPIKKKGKKGVVPLDADNVFALVDGNKLPKEIPCAAEAVVKGDSKEYSIAAASILAKVTRDRLMEAYSELYPEYNLKQHKGYPTAAHMAAVHEFGASPIHRRTFAPLKHMQLDKLGNIIPATTSETNKSETKKKK